MHLDKVRSDYRQTWAAAEDCSAKAKHSLGEHDNFHLICNHAYATIQHRQNCSDIGGKTLELLFKA